MGHLFSARSVRRPCRRLKMPIMTLLRFQGSTRPAPLPWTAPSGSRLVLGFHRNSLMIFNCRHFGSRVSNDIRDSNLPRGRPVVNECGNMRSTLLPRMRVCMRACHACGGCLHFHVVHHEGWGVHFSAPFSGEFWGRAFAFLPPCTARLACRDWPDSHVHMQVSVCDCTLCVRKVPSWRFLC